MTPRHPHEVSAALRCYNGATLPRTSRLVMTRADWRHEAADLIDRLSSELTQAIRERDEAMRVSRRLGDDREKAERELSEARAALAQANEKFAMHTAEVGAWLSLLSQELGGIAPDASVTVKDACEQILRQSNRLMERATKAEALCYVPGVLKCAKCGCVLITTNLHAETGQFSANNEPQRCPNDCGPMWRRTEREAGNELCDRLEEALARLPEGMKHCTILFKECEKGHGELTATNWVQHECAVCRVERAEASCRSHAEAIATLRDALDDLKVVAADNFPSVVARRSARVQDALQKAIKKAAEAMRAPVPDLACKLSKALAALPASPPAQAASPPRKDQP